MVNNIHPWLAKAHSSQHNSVIMQENTQLAIQESSSCGGLFMQVRTMDDAARLCKALATSKMTPDAFKNDHGAILMALNVSQSMGCDLFMVMQSMYAVHGRMGFSGQFCISALNRHPNYRRIEYRYVNGKDWTSGIQVIGHRHDGETDIGTAITPEMVQAEGWNKNPKWKSMPEQMYKYRAAAFFVRTFCPDALMGYQTVEELRDLEANGTFRPARVTPAPAPVPAPVQEDVIEAETVETTEA